MAYRETPPGSYLRQIPWERSGGFRAHFNAGLFMPNQLLHIGVEQGIPGVLLFCCVAYLGLSGPVKTTGQRGARAALCGQLAAGLTETPWADPLLLFLFWCGWAYLREAADG